jgi:DNA-directed RNA polymerase specialized sigma24 family protein
LLSTPRLDWIAFDLIQGALVVGLAKRIVEEVPQLRRYARALTRNSAAVDDLVQEFVERALTRQHLWEEGTNLKAWLFTIAHNQYVNQVRYLARRGVTWAHRRRAVLVALSLVRKPLGSRRSGSLDTLKI